NAAGEASETRVLHWSVSPPWWRTPWALAGFALLALLLSGWAVAAWRERERERQAMRLVEHERALAEPASLAKRRFLATLGPHDRRARHGRTVARHAAGREAARLRGIDPRRRPPPAAAGQRRAGPGADRGRPAGARIAPVRGAGPARRRRRAARAAGPPARAAVRVPDGRGCAAGAARRPAAHPPDPVQPGRQRDQVHPRRRGRAAGRAAGPRARRALRGARYRAGPERRPAHAPVPALRAGRGRAHHRALRRQRP